MKITRLLALLCAVNVFATRSLANTIVEFNTSLGIVDVSLYDNVAPQTVANFLNYVQSHAYDNTIIHRSVPAFVIQGGGFNTQGNAIPTNPPIPLEYNLPNARGTLAMARTFSPNSATDQWFFNTVDNSQVLGPQNAGGYAVFGQVLGNGMNVIDAIAALPTFNFQGVFGQLPLRNYTQTDFNNHVPLTTANFVVVNSIVVVPEPSSAVLGGVGAAVAIASCWYRRRRTSATH